LCSEILGTNPAVGKISNFGQVIDGGGPWVVVKTCPIKMGEKKYKSHNIRRIMDGREHRKRKLKIRAPQCRQVHSWGEVTNRPVLRTMARVR
jgi:hypothetical protein